MKKVGHIMMNSFLFCFKEAFISIYRNRWLSIAAIGTVCVSLVILGISILMVYNANDLTERLESQLEIQVYIDDGVSEEATVALGEVLGKMKGVSSADFVSKEDGLENFRKKLGDNKAFVEGLDGDNPLPDAYMIKALQAENVPELASKMEKLEGVGTVTYGQGTVEKLLVVIHWMRIIGAGLIIALGIGALLLITTTIRLSVFARRREINIMKYLGSTNWFVRFPFLLEGMVLGFLGAVLGAIVVYLAYLSLAGNLNEVLPFAVLVTSWTILRNVLLSLLLIGLFIGATAGWFSVKRYLQV